MGSRIDRRNLFQELVLGGIDIDDPTVSPDAPKIPETF
jgi:hypothetical protein